MTYYPERNVPLTYPNLSDCPLEVHVYKSDAHARNEIGSADPPPPRAFHS